MTDNKSGAEKEIIDPEVQKWMSACQSMAGRIQEIADAYGVENVMRALTFNLNSLFAFGLEVDKDPKDFMEEFITNLREEQREMQTYFKFDLKN